MDVSTQPWQRTLEKAYILVQTRCPSDITKAYLADFTQRNLNALRAVVGAPVGTADVLHAAFERSEREQEAYHARIEADAEVHAQEVVELPRSVTPAMAQAFLHYRELDDADRYAAEDYLYETVAPTCGLTGFNRAHNPLLDEELERPLGHPAYRWLRAGEYLTGGPPTDEGLEPQGRKQGGERGHIYPFDQTGRGRAYMDAEDTLWWSMLQDRAKGGSADVPTNAKTRVRLVYAGDKPNEERYYSLPPREALVAAIEQARGNYNTWDYPKVVPEETVEDLTHTGRRRLRWWDEANERQFFAYDEGPITLAVPVVVPSPVTTPPPAVVRIKEPERARRYIARSSDRDDSFSVINQGSSEISDGSFARARRQFLQHNDVTDADQIPLWDGVVGKMTTVGAWLAEVDANAEQATAEQKAVEATEDVHDMIPADSDVKQHDQLSVWDGYLAAVRQPNMRYDVDLDKMAAPWIIHYVDEGEGKPARADKYPELIGVYFRHSAGTNRFSYSRPMSGMSSVGTFLNGVRYWLRSDVADLPPEAMSSVKRRWEEQGYIDTSDYSWQKADKLTKGQWIKVFAIAEPGKDLEAVYDAFPDDYDKGNAVYSMLSWIAENASTSAYPGHGQYADLGTLLLNLPGVFKTSKDTRFLWKIEAAEVRARKPVKPRVEKPTSEDEEEVTLQARLQDRRDLLDLARFYFTRLEDKDRQPEWGSRGSTAPSGGGDNNPFYRFVDGGLIVQSGTRFLSHAGIDVDLYDVTPKALELLDSYGLRKKIEEDVSHLDQPDEQTYSRALHYAMAALRRPLDAEAAYQEKVKMVADVKRNKAARETLLALFDLSYPDGKGDPFNIPHFIVSREESFDDIPKKTWDWLVKHGLAQWYSRTYHPHIMLTEDGLVVAQILRGGSLPRNVVFDVYDDE